MGGDLPPMTTDMTQALLAAGFMSNGYGGMDAGWLPIVVELLGITDVELLLWQLLTIRQHEAPTLGAAERQGHNGGTAER